MAITGPAQSVWVLNQHALRWTFSSAKESLNHQNTPFSQRRDRGIHNISGGRKTVLLILRFWSIHETRGIFLDICTSTARSTKQPKLVSDISSKCVLFVPSRGDASKRCQNTFQIERLIDVAFITS